ncbi:DNA excision repair protein ERCC-1 isoform X2 [Opisthocomus hoazin]|uniref:DNA excision repair protein ERCC-1 isoform X2 n=1 Tax=Opisthocomus hoazin TaxID=30419 RepID=UPI003F53C1EF
MAAAGAQAPGAKRARFTLRPEEPGDSAVPSLSPAPPRPSPPAEAPPAPGGAPPALPLPALKPGAKSSGIVVSPRQRGNPVLRHVRAVPWEFGDVVPDYVLGQGTCALFLSVRYHHLHPQYVHARLRELGRSYALRLLLLLADVRDPQQALKELAKVCILADCTLLVAWSRWQPWWPHPARICPSAPAWGHRRPSDSSMSCTSPSSRAPSEQPPPPENLLLLLINGI